MQGARVNGHDRDREHHQGESVRARGSTTPPHVTGGTFGQGVLLARGSLGDPHATGAPMAPPFR